MEVIVRDGQNYKEGETPWDLGSLQCIDEDGNQRYYHGFVQDKNKLPKYDNLGTGSMAELIDPNGVEEIIIGRYDAQTKHWYHYPEGGVIV